MENIEVDGSILEGGGQILRISIAFSAVTGSPLRLYNIRAKRSQPGLRPQHLNAVKAVASLTEAEVRGLEVGSQTVEFIPKGRRGGEFKIDIGTAGSTSLVLQALMPTLAFAADRVKVEIRGGTNNQMAPPIDYLQHVLLPVVERMGFRGSISLVRRGFYPRGQGIVQASSEPAKNLQPINLLNLGQIASIFGLSYSCRLPSHIVERMALSAERALDRASYRNVTIRRECLTPRDTRCSVDPGCGIVLVAKTSSGAILATDALGEFRKPAEKVGEEAAMDLIRQLKSGAAVDKHLADQLIIYASLADGRSAMRVSEYTLHTASCIEISKRIVGARFEVEGKIGEPAAISCQGVGLSNI